MTDQFVAGEMAQRIVDVLEAIEADAQNRNLTAMAFNAFARLGQAVGEQSTVRQAGQGVVQRHMLGLGLAGDQ